MPHIPIKTHPSSSCVKYAAYTDAKDRLKKARAMAREKARLRELRHIALFMAEDIYRNADTVPVTPERRGPQDEFSIMNEEIWIENFDHYKRLVKVVYVQK
jgi:hypothetical protein